MRNHKKQLVKLLYIISIVTVIAGTPSMSSAHVVTAASKEEVRKTPTISEKKLPMVIGESKYLELQNATSKVTWKNDDASIASVNEYGYVTAVSEGVTTVFAIHSGKTYSSRITVYKQRLVTESSEYIIYKETNIKLTLSNKKSWENITVTASDEGIVDIGNITWVGNEASIPLTTLKKGTTTLSISRTKSVEPCTITVRVIDKEEREALEATKIYEEVSKSMVEITMVTKDNKDSLGSGFFIGDGMILTNYHVIEDASSIKVIDYDGNEYLVTTIYDYNKTYDLAVLGVKGTKPPLSLSEDKLTAGEIVYSIGSPYGYTGTFSKGIIGTASRVIDEVDYIQITAPISRGNSGGPLLNRFGEVIGVNTMTRVDAQNVNFSVNIKYLKQLDLSNKKDISTYLK